MRKWIPMFLIGLATLAAVAFVWMPSSSRSSSARTSSSRDPSTPTPEVAKPEPTKPEPSKRNRPTKSLAEGGAPVAECGECQQRECGNLVSVCQGLEGVAADGPAKGTPRAQLCEQMVECARRTGCATPVTLSCYCGNNDVSNCLGGKGDGLCRKAYEAAAESTEPDKVFRRLANEKKFAIGAAEPLLTCETRGCTSECVPYYR